MVIEYASESGLQLYAILRSNSAQFYNPTTGLFESLTLSLDHNIYRLPLTEDTDITGYYAYPALAIPEGTYYVEYWQQIDASYDRASDTFLGEVTFYWDGSFEWETYSQFLTYSQIAALQQSLGSLGGSTGSSDLGGLLTSALRILRNLEARR